MTRVEINTGSRLHFGLLAHLPQTGRHFGGVGLMIDAPGVKLSAEVAPRDEVIGPRFLIPRIKKLIARCRESVPTIQQRPACRVEIHEYIPRHQGLGSGTQLALAVGKALSVLAGEADLSTVELARRVGRGARSALGLHGFEHGGFLVDGGKSDLEDIGSLVSRVEFPEDWRVVLISPDEEPGLSGTKEQTAFRKLTGMPESLTNHLCRLILMDLLPAVVERDFNAFGEAVFEYGQQVGTYFAPIQGGRLASPQMKELAQVLRKRGIAGVGQSSWGPALFAFLESQSEAVPLLCELAENRHAVNCQLQMAKPLNQAATVLIETD